jgi:hypothetical protein
MGTIDDLHAPGTARRGRRPATLAAAAVVVLAAGAVLWWATAPDALRGQGSVGTVPAELGEPVYVGHMSMASRPVTVVRLEPVLATDGLDATVWVCDPMPDQTPIGMVGSEDVADYCRDLQPVAPGVTLEVHEDARDELPPYLLTELRATAPGPQVFCGLDVTYRDGWRTGRHREAGLTRIVLNPEDEGGVPPDDDGLDDGSRHTALCGR